MGFKDSKLLIRCFAAFFLIFIPPLIFEKYTFYLYATLNPSFFHYSGWRLWFDIMWFIGSGALSAIIVGRRRTLSALVPVIGAGAFIISVYFMPFCDPRECYISSTDGLGALRDYLLFASLGVLACNAVFSTDSTKSLTRKARMIYAYAISTLVGFALSFYPVVHIFAGVTLPYPLNYGQWFLAGAPSGFVSSFIATGRTQDLSPRSGRLFSFVSGLSGPVLAIALNADLPCQACSNYAPSITSLLVLGAAFSLGGTFAGEMIAKPISKKSLRRTIASIATAVCIIVTVVLLLAFYFSTSYQMSVVDELGTTNTTFSPLEIGSTFVYAGGYASIPHLATEGVGVSVNFANSSIASSPSNFIAAGVGDQSPNCCKDGLDLAYRADAVLFSNGTEALFARGWWACDTNAACGGYSWQQLLFFNETVLPRGTLLSKWVDIEMNWSSQATIEWFYRINGTSQSNWIEYSSFRPPAIDNHYFDAGMYYLGAANRPTPYAYFFQFGVSSSSVIQGNNWKVLMSCPKLIINGTWTCVPSAAFIQGRDSLWKVLYTFGANYQGLSFTYLGNFTTEFYYSGNSPTTGTTIWASVP